MAETVNPRLVAIAAYLKAVGKSLARGDSTEHTHRAALQTLIQALQKGIVCVNEPRGTQVAGHPDMKVLLGETPLGFIETKDIRANLDETADSAQLKRYRAALPNLILTDYLEFRWFQNGEMVDRVRIADALPGGKLRRRFDQQEKLLTLLDNFVQSNVKTVGSPKELAERMASLAKWVRRVIVEAFNAEAAGAELHSQLRAFREVLLPDLDVDKFADMYAQTICYGLFAGKCSADAGVTFARDNAASYLPRTNPFLRKLFASIMAGDLNTRVAAAIDAITFLLNHADIAAILKDFGKRTRQEDPVVHFYETFLAAYDPKLRKSRGVYYTPEPVVSYIVRSVDWLLKDKFGKKDGLADPTVLVLDPACGTGTFLYHVIKLIEERVKAKGQYGTWSGYVRDNLLPRVFGFELLMAPYAVAHLKLGLLLQDTGYDFSGDERLGVYLTNTLEDSARKSDELWAKWLTVESEAANRIKKSEPVMVVLGNPPYSGHSANRSLLETPLVEEIQYTGPDGVVRAKKVKTTKTFIGQLLDDYYLVDGKPLGERNPKWLQDDYVKFIRWSQWRIEKTGHGIHAFITNNGYLDNPTFRGMRRKLMLSFDELYLLDLHGNIKKKESAPDGGPDKNVFDIKQGVALGMFAKLPAARKPDQTSAASTGAVVRHYDLWGTRESKYSHLLTSCAIDEQWQSHKPEPPLYLFAVVDVALKPEYERAWRICDLMPRTLLGPNSHRDHFAIAFSESEAAERVANFFNPSMDDDRIRDMYELQDNRDWQLKRARSFSSAKPTPVECVYRPFDYRFMLYGPHAFDYHRPEVNDALLLHGLGIVTTRQTREPFSALAVGKPVGQHKVATPYDGSYVSPLYVGRASGSQKQQSLDDASPWPAGKDGRVPNLSPKFVAEMESKLGLKFVPEQPPAISRRPSAVSAFGPEDVFHYIYAVFHSPTYRKRYAEFLKIDFPRVPLTSDKKQFWKLVELGRELVGLHLLESPQVDEFVTQYPKKGSDTVERVVFAPPDPSVIPGAGRAGSPRPDSATPRRRTSRGDSDAGRVYINDEQYFSGVRPEEWEFHIGGYQVLQKWLKDRKGRRLSADDIRHYQRVVVAIRNTIRLMSAIDKAIPKWPM